MATRREFLWAGGLALAVALILLWALLGILKRRRFP